ncbi:N-acetyl-gamma-glutamyl-phosphate reductase [Clostridiales bacterium]|nr:N-acetyl-gamma-glutamyl-phosphate reductase [Clostridiales bacterium]
MADKTKIFIDGREGTTGLRIYDRLNTMEEIELMILEDEKRKDTEMRRQMLNSCDIAFLCLPDTAAIEAVDLVENENVVIIDTSTAHRTASDWAYGLPELGEKYRNQIINSKRIAVPGCHASGFISLIQPLVESGIISKATRLTCFSLTGYSGGGKKMIAEYESSNRAEIYDAPRQYGISQQHKHLKEMTAVTGLELIPSFCPIVGDFYSGMEVAVPIFKEDLMGNFSTEDIKNVYKAKYSGNIVTYVENDSLNGFYSANDLSGYDNMRISVDGNDDRILLTSRYDNLGKGASGAAIECMNYKLGNMPSKGLNIKEKII